MGGSDIQEIIHNTVISAVAWQLRGAVLTFPKPETHSRRSREAGDSSIFGIGFLYINHRPHFLYPGVTKLRLFIFTHENCDLENRYDTLDYIRLSVVM